MIRIKLHIVGIFTIILAVSCSIERTICPAYQSAFIHDKTILDRHFSYFGEDSMPKVLEASKDKHLLIDPVTYRKKMRSLQTVAMKDVYPQPPDSLAFNDEFSEAELDPSEIPAIDSTATASAVGDSIYVISLEKEKFNIDQELYLWYLRKFLVYPDVKLQMEENAEMNGKASGTEKVGFFKKLFGGKKKDKTNFDVETSATELDEDTSGKKKKGFSLFKKKDKKSKEKTTDNLAPDNPPPSEPEPEEEDDGDEDF